MRIANDKYNHLQREYANKYHKSVSFEETYRDPIDVNETSINDNSNYNDDRNNRPEARQSYYLERSPSYRRLGGPYTSQRMSSKGEDLPYHEIRENYDPTILPRVQYNRNQDWTPREVI